MAPEELDRLLKAMMLKDMRIQCRARGLSPAGGKEQLTDRLKEHMIATNDFTMRSETGEVLESGEVQAGSTTRDMEAGNLRNNYSRPEGQNVGNFLTDRKSSRVLAAPGGASSICLGDDGGAPVPAARFGGKAPGAMAPTDPNGHHASSNNYSRPEGQNVGNFLTDRNSSRVLAPPGGGSSIIFG